MTLRPPKRGRGTSSARRATSSRRAPTVPAGKNSRWAVLASLTLVSFLLLLGDTAVALALPAISRQLDLGLAGLEWIVNGYMLPLAALMLLGGQLADRHGPRRVFLVGVGMFVVGSLAAGLAGGSPHPSVDLIAARALQGVGAALVAPASLSIISSTFSRDERGLALGIWAGVTATALGLGPVLGAVVTDTLGWAWIFLLNVPLGIAVWLVAWRWLVEPRARHITGGLDIPGVVSSAVALSGTLLVLTEGNDYGWTSPRVLLLAAAAIAGAAAFVSIERRAAHPLVEFSFLRRPAVAGPNLVILLSTAVMCSLFFFLALYLQIVLGQSALGAGVALLPLTVAIVITAPAAGRVADRVGARLPVVAGMTLLAGALLGLSTAGTGSTAPSLVPWLVLAGAGIGLATTPTTAAAMSDEASARPGEAAAVFNTFRATGLAIGVALMGAVLGAFGAGAAGRPAAFVDGFSAAVTINAGIALATAAIAVLTLPGIRHRRRAVRGAHCRPKPETASGGIG